MEYGELNLIPQISSSAVCAFTGNRAYKLPWAENSSEGKRVKERLKAAIKEEIERGKILFVCGMAEGADIYFAEAVIEIRKEYPHILLEAAIPYPNQEKSRGKAEIERYNRVLEKCDFRAVISPEGSKYAPLKRNRYMVDKCSTLIALNYHKTGGTAYTIEYARKKNKEIIHLA